MSFLSPVEQMTFQDVLEWTIENNKKDYKAPVERCSQLMENRRLQDIPACHSDFHGRFPINGFDPRYFKTEDAYKAWRRKVSAAIKGATGQLKAERERRSRQDDWADLIAAIKLLVGQPPEAKLSLNALIPINNLADLARQYGKRPDQVTQEWLYDLRSNLGSGEWKSLQCAIRRLNDLRDAPSVLMYLPANPYDAEKKLRDNVLTGIPDRLSEEISIWVTASAQQRYDPVEQEYTGESSVGNIGVKSAALRKYVSTLALSELVKISSDTKVSDLLTPKNAEIVIRAWTRNTNGKGKISPRTAFNYFSQIYFLMDRNGICPSALKAHVSDNRFLKEGKKCGKGMSKKTVVFCETLLGSKKLTMNFLSMHVQLRNKAQTLINDIAESGRSMNSYEKKKIRAIGTVAAFCALETRGAPIRVSNALALKFRGDAITFHLPTAKTDHATISLSPEHTKNNVNIWAPIKPKNLSGLEVINWYFEHIRPLYSGSENSEFVFPAIKAGRHLQYKTFLGWCKRHTRSVGLPVTPHNFRHGLASLLIQKNPGRWDLLERLLDDTIATIRKNYAWVDKRRAIAEVQKFVLDLSEL